MGDTPRNDAHRSTTSSRDKETNKLNLKGQGKEKLAMNYLISSCSHAVMHTIDPSANAIENLDKLNKQYGFGNLDPAVILKELRSGLIKEKGIPYTHHHPGKAERSHQTILRMARAMLKDSKLPQNSTTKLKDVPLTCLIGCRMEKMNLVYMNTSLEENQTLPTEDHLELCALLMFHLKNEPN
jgi:hypothetical protein